MLFFVFELVVTKLSKTQLDLCPKTPSRRLTVKNLISVNVGVHSIEDVFHACLDGVVNVLSINHLG